MVQGCLGPWEGLMGASEQASGLDRSPQRPHDVSLVSVGRDMAASEQACGLDKESAAASRRVPGVCWRVPRHGRPQWTCLRSPGGGPPGRLSLNHEVILLPLSRRLPTHRLLPRVRKNARPWGSHLYGLLCSQGHCPQFCQSGRSARPGVHQQGDSAQLSSGRSLVKNTRGSPNCSRGRIGGATSCTSVSVGKGLSSGKPHPPVIRKAPDNLEVPFPP